MLRPELFLLFMALSLLFATGCSLDMDQEGFSEELSGEVPNTVMRSYRQVVVEDQRKVMEISADTVKAYDEQKKLIMEELRFTEFDRQGEVVHTGRAGRAEHRYGDQELLLQGDVLLESRQDDETIQVSGEAFRWYEKEYLIEAPEEEEVHFSYGREGSLTGRGFSARTDTGTIRFTGGARGLFRAGEESQGE